MLNSQDPDPVISLIETFWLAEDERIKVDRKQKDACFSKIPEDEYSKTLQDEYSKALKKKENVFQLLSEATPLSTRGAIEMLSVALSEVHTHSLPTPERYSPSVCHPYTIEVLHRVRDFLEGCGGGEALDYDFWT
jgi:hypothetical protein